MIRSSNEIITIANDLFKNYCGGVNKLKYNCNYLLNFLLSFNAIRYHTYDFGTKKFYGMLVEMDGEWAITTNSTHSEQQKNFTIGHELGHYYCHKNQESYFMENKIEMLDSSNRIMEYEANLFASELLIPQQVLDAMLAEHFHFYQICKITNTSKLCLYWRLVRHLKDTYGFDYQSAKYYVEQYKEHSEPNLRMYVNRTYMLRFTKEMKYTENVAEQAELYSFDRF